jgi:chaperonin GroES
MFRPREYKVVNASAGSIRDAIYERTFPNPSPIMMSLLQLILGAANDVAAIKDVTSGDASNNGQVGTTLALIEQGLQVFTAIYKRIHRGLRAEFQLIFKNLADYGDEKTVKDYLDVVDTPEADFAKDFGQKDMDIRPVSDPNMVTRLQKMAKAQFLMQTGTNNPNVDQRELITRVFEAADVEDMEKIIPPPVQGQTDPEMVANLDKIASEAERNKAQAMLSLANADKTKAETAKIGTDVGTQIGIAEGGMNAEDNGRRVSDLEGSPGNAMGDAGV